MSSEDNRLQRTDEPPPPQPDTPADTAAPRNPARRIARWLLLLLAVLVTWYVISDRLVPFSSRATAIFSSQARVAQESANLNPVHIELEGGLDNWPHAVRAGGKVSVTIYATGTNHPFAWMAAGLHRIQSVLSYLY